MLLTPMAVAGEEPIGSMGDDTPLAVLSDRAKPLYTYFRQLFAQVTNPPIDPIREQLVMSLVSFIGPRPNLLSPDQTEPVMRLEVSQPILTFEDMEKLRRAHDVHARPLQERDPVHVLSRRMGRGRHGAGARAALRGRGGRGAQGDATNIVILTDRDVAAGLIPIPALLATAAVHHHLVRAGLRTRCGLVVETGSAREVHHFACLAGFGAEAIHPNLAFATLIDMRGDLLAEDRREGDRQALHQGDRQGPAQGDVQDGHLHLPVVLRRADLRGGGALRERSSTSTSPARPRRSRASA